MIWEMNVSLNVFHASNQPPMEEECSLVDVVKDSTRKTSPPFIELYFIASMPIHPSIKSPPKIERELFSTPFKNSFLGASTCGSMHRHRQNVQVISWHKEDGLSGFGPNVKWGIGLINCDSLR